MPGKTGWPEKADWTVVFGEDAGEIFSAWFFASALERIASVGKKEYPLPCYANVWLKQFPWYAGSYPSGSRRWRICSGCGKRRRLPSLLLPRISMSPMCRRSWRSIPVRIIPCNPGGAKRRCNSVIRSGTLPLLPCPVLRTVRD